LTVSALWRDRAASEAEDAVAGSVSARRLLPMVWAHLDAVLAVEASAYSFPWSRGNFVDSLAAGHVARVLLDVSGAVLGYFAMRGADEIHLLNITVAPAAQGRGHARVLIDALLALCRAERVRELWLEVRVSNERARAMYERRGFVRVGLRKGYYPAAAGRREDALLMSLKLDDAEPGEVNDALE
jgi:ribosomal-protein-alanine N-acetyltransferase